MYKCVMFIFTVIFGLSQILDAQASSKILLEEQEITLFDENGTEIKRLVTDHSSPEAKNIGKEIQDKVLKKLGVYSYKEVSKKRLEAKYNQEINKLIKSIELNEPKLKFIDSKGNIVEQIELVGYGKPSLEEIKIEKVDGKEIKINQTLSRRIKLPKDRTFVALVESVDRRLANETGNKEINQENQRRIQLGYKDTLEYYDKDGRQLFQKGTPLNMAISDIVVSDDGNIIAFIQSYTIGEAAENEPYQKLRVYSKDGKELLKYPENQESIQFTAGMALSPDGKYLQVSIIGFDLFFDTQGNLFGQIPAKSAPYWIDNNGIATIRNPDKPFETLNIKDYLKNKNNK